MFLIFSLGFLILFYNIYYNYFYYLIKLTRFIGYLTIYIQKFNNKFKTKNNISINKIILNNKDIIEISITLLKLYEKDYNSIEIYYIIDNIKYLIIYSKENKISEIGFSYNLFKCKEPHNAFTRTSENILLLELINSKTNYNDTIKEKILDIIKLVSGPKGDFYKSINYNLNKKLLINIINKKLDIDLNYDIGFNILYSNGDEILL